MEIQRSNPLRTLATPQTKAALDALVQLLEERGGEAHRYEKVIVVSSTTGKPMLNAITADNQQWSVQVTREIAAAYGLPLWSTL
jgi:enamine deaminase RidA (YjgF/YER057c/UK114 family)